MSFPRYPKYKASGVEWLGDVPEHWELKATKRLFQLVAEPAPDDNAYELLSIYTAIGVRPRKELEAKGNKASTTDGYWLVKKGDLVVNKLLAWMGAIGISEYDGVTSPAYDILRKRIPLDPRFYDYLFRCGICFSEFRRWSRGIMDMRLRLYFDELGRLVMPFPSESEQAAITSFLDRETAKIDALVAEQKRLMELLKEKRQAVISHAVTKGLNPNAKMKPSGIDWLGDVPEGWEVRRLKTILSEPLKYGANESAELDDPTQPRFVRITDIDDSGNLRDETFKSLPFEVAEPFLLVEGDVLLARSGATVGKTFIYSEHWGTACFAGYLIRARLNKKICMAKWLYYFCQTNSYWGYVIGSQIQATIQNVSAEKYANLYLPLPPLAEQTAIKSFLEIQTAKFDTLTTEAQRAIDLLQERRSALISAAVTGQIDVRGLVPSEAA